MAIAEQRRVIALAILNEIIQQDADDDYIISQEINASNYAIHVGNSDNKEGPREFSGMEGYVEYTITVYSDPYIRKHFRMSRQSFQARQENVRNDVLIRISCCRSYLVKCRTFCPHLLNRFFLFSFKQYI